MKGIGGRVVRLRFVLQAAKLFGFRFVKAGDGAMATKTDDDVLDKRTSTATANAVCFDFVSPPMGWNSYDSQVGLTDGNGGQGEAVALASAEFVAANLKHHGYEYIVLDAGW